MINDNGNVNYYATAEPVGTVMPMCSGMDYVEVVVTDFSDVRIGPKWAAFIADRTTGLVSNKRTKKYKQARQNAKEIETAINVMAWYEWAQGGVLEELP